MITSPLALCVVIATMEYMARVFISFGTNLGDREEKLRDAWRRVARVVDITRASAVYETEPWGVSAQPRYLNVVIEGETDLAPQELLRALKAIEQAMGRITGMRYGPRIIDLDILFYDNLVYKTPDLEIPHPRITERRFVLVPLTELAPDFLHPQVKRSMRELLGTLPDKGGEQKHAPLEKFPPPLTDAPSNN